MATVVIQKRTRENGTSYVVTYKDLASGRKRYYKTFRKAKEAQQAANELRYLLDNGKSVDSKPQRKTKLMTVAQVAELLDQQWENKLKIGELSPVTVDGYRVWCKQIVESYGHRILCELTREEIKLHRDTMAQNKAGGKSHARTNRIMFVFKQICAHGIEIGAIDESPVAGIGQLSEKAHERNEFLMPDGLIRIVEACKKVVKARYYLPALILLGAEHGASKQEALSLRWKDIDFEYKGSGLIHLFRTKNQRERTELLLPQTRAALIAWRAHLTEMRQKKNIIPKDDSYVFCRLDGARIKGFKSAWDRVRNLAGVEDLHFHDLRHTFCSNLLLVGADLKDIKDMIGHSDLNMTDRYAHLCNARKNVLQDKLADHFEGAFPVPKPSEGIEGNT